MRPPRAFRKTASVSARAARRGRCAACSRPSREVRARARARAVRPIGTMRSLSPLPSTRTHAVLEVEVAEVEADRFADADARSRRAVSSSARSRCAQRRVAGDRAEQTRRPASSSSAFGMPCGTRGAPTSSLGSVGEQPSRARRTGGTNAPRRAHRAIDAGASSGRPSSSRERLEVRDVVRARSCSPIAAGSVDARVDEERRVAPQVAAVRGERVRARGRARPPASRRARSSSAPSCVHGHGSPARHRSLSARRTARRPCRSAGAATDLRPAGAAASTNAANSGCGRFGPALELGVRLRRDEERVVDAAR